MGKRRVARAGNRVGGVCDAGGDGGDALQGCIIPSYFRLSNLVFAMDYQVDWNVVRDGSWMNGGSAIVYISW